MITILLCGDERAKHYLISRPKLKGNDLRRRHTAALTSSAAARPLPMAQLPYKPNMSVSVIGDSANTSMASQMGEANARSESSVLSQRPPVRGGHLQRRESSFGVNG